MIAMWLIWIKLKPNFSTARPYQITVRKIYNSIFNNFLVMAIANQIKALLKSHIDGDEAMFLSVAMQMAAQEAKKGHSNLAKQIGDLIDSTKSKPRLTESKAIPLAKPKSELSQLLNLSYPQLRLADMVLSENIQAPLDHLIKEHKHLQLLRSNPSGGTCRISGIGLVVSLIKLPSL